MLGFGTKSMVSTLVAGDVGPNSRLGESVLGGKHHQVHGLLG